MNEYVPPTLVVDAVVFQIINNELGVLLIRRAQEPFIGMWALPGGYNPAGETTREAFARVLLAKAGVHEQSLGLVEQLSAFDTVARDPRGHAVSITYLGLGTNLRPEKSPTTQSPHFFPLSQLPKLAYDHADIIRYAHKHLKIEVLATAAIAALLPKQFTFASLQLAYEAVLGRLLDKRNFRKKFLSFDAITATEEFARQGAHRPAQLYTFNRTVTQPLARSFDEPSAV